MTTRFHQCRARTYDRLRVRDVFDHLETRDHVESTGASGASASALIWRYSTSTWIRPRAAARPRRAFREIGAEYACTTCRQRFRQNAPAAADLHDPFTNEFTASRDVVDAQRIDVVQRAEFALGIPPPMRE